MSTLPEITEPKHHRFESQSISDEILCNASEIAEADEYCDSDFSDNDGLIKFLQMKKDRKKVMFI